ncbi:glyoxylase-like metal-dependent hydrolase (beta-lactamase superfamily II) [Pseudonocardia sediminis]|uniref:Glyoxylase-like metal-dependent hydrolase (Beta-lactamase superfamily II) n=1 Tax=Pseudonocardia sediminis TaxID=1397368 RepID=A0A4Q7V2X7_PSEST|nr:MBL fold metallo-hydrolase [Pseudonocardia sediminis]RZT87844.1 glyoxylase-like metal-dependent hydrolase (beta-lactamase superfamily II) [Pseudonocardia sediminis]
MSAGDGRWVGLADGVLARRHDELDLTTGLVLGADRALVVDTRGDARQGAELAAAVRAVTDLPVTVVLTHAHFDHCFGTAAFGPVPVYAQAGCAAAISATAAQQRTEWVRYYREHGDPATADALAATDPPLPDRPVCPRPGDTALLDLGGRRAVLLHPGPGHTGHDLAVHLPDDAVLFAGDLLENGAPPSHGPDAHPADWPAAVDALLALGATRIAPGHGDPMTPSQAVAQRDELAVVARLHTGPSAQ